VNTNEDILKPYPNEHACRILPPGNFQSNSFRRKNIKKGIDIITGRLTDQITMTTQSYRFKTDVFTEAEARKWCKDHKLKCNPFEPAKKSLLKTFIENLRI